MENLTLKTAPPKKLECSLRKKCQHCGEQYGRKPRGGGNGSQYFEAMQSFERSKFCGTDCRNAALGNKNEKAAAARLERERIAQVVQPAAMQAFLFSRPMEDV